MSEAPAPAMPPSPTVPQPKGNRILLWLSVLCLLVGLGLFFWTKYTNSPGYLARKHLSKAEQLARDGDLEEAGRIYRALAIESPEHVKPALAGFRKMLGKSLDTAPLEQVAGVLDVAINWPDAPYLREGLADRAMGLLREKGEKDIDGALRLLNITVSTPMAKDEAHFNKLVKEGDELLEGWVKKFPDHIEVLTNYANLLYRRNDSAGIIKVLAPHREKLGNGEGSHLLGLAYAGQGKNDLALELLEPYCKERLPRYLKAAVEYRKAFTELISSLQPQIDDGTAPDFDYDLYRRANEESKNVIVRGYIETRLRDKPEARAAQVELSQLSRLPGDVLGLGRLQFGTAQARTDPAARKAGLEMARDTFKSLRDMAPDNLNVYLFSGAVAYWMGDKKEAQELFELPLKMTARAVPSLLQVANAYRDVGEFATARKLLEEAYDKEKKKGNKDEIAFRRSRTPIDTEDEIAWLKKCDDKAGSIKLALLQSQAKQADDQGRLSEAAEILRKALTLVEKDLPASLGRDNETGLLWLWLFRVSGDRAALSKGLELLDKAMAQPPVSPIIVHNATLNVFYNACLDLALESLEPGVLRMREALLLLDYLYNDRPGRDQQADRLRKHSGMVKARELAKKLLTLQPRQPLAYEVLTPLYVWERDVKGLEELNARLRDVGVDESEAIRIHLGRIANKDEDRVKQERKRALERWEKLAGEMRDKKKDASLAVALVNLVRALLIGEDLGEKIDADKVVKLAEEAHAAHLCRATTEKLVDALLYRAHRQLIQGDAEYRKMAERARRSLDPSHLMALALTREGSAKALALANADVIRAVKLLKERSEAFPDEPNPWVYAMLKATQPEAAAKVAEALKTNEVQRLARAITLKLKPLTLADALGQYWVLKLEGKDKESDALLRTLGDRGVPLPFDVGK